MTKYCCCTLQQCTVAVGLVALALTAGEIGIFSHLTTVNKFENYNYLLVYLISTGTVKIILTVIMIVAAISRMYQPLLVWCIFTVIQLIVEGASVIMVNIWGYEPLNLLFGIVQGLFVYFLGVVYDFYLELKYSNSPTSQVTQSFPIQPMMMMNAGAHSNQMSPQQFNMHYYQQPSYSGPN